MRRRIEALADRFEEFVSEDGHDALVIECADEGGLGLVGAAVDALEQRGSCDIAIPCLEAFDGVDGFAERLLAYIDGFLAEAGLSPRPGTAGSPLASALDALVHFAGAVRRDGDVRVAVCLLPPHIHDRDAYEGVALTVCRAARRVTPPLRVVVRDVDARIRSALAALAVPSLALEVDTSPAAMREALAAEAADPRNDPEVRAAALLSTALADAAAGREREALPVLALLARVYEERGDNSTRALCFVLGGNVHLQLGELDEARALVSRGLALAVDAKAVGIVLVGAMLAGHLSMRAGDAADADVRFDVAARLGAKVASPLIVADALLARGEALRTRGLLREACDAWTCAASAARRASSVAHERRALAAIAAIYRDAGELARTRAVERRIELLDARPQPSCGHEHAS